MFQHLLRLEQEQIRQEVRQVRQLFREAPPSELPLIKRWGVNFVQHLGKDSCPAGLAAWKIMWRGTLRDLSTTTGRWKRARRRPVWAAASGPGRPCHGPGGRAAISWTSPAVSCAEFHPSPCRMPWP